MVEVHGDVKGVGRDVDGKQDSLMPVLRESRRSTHVQGEGNEPERNTKKDKKRSRGAAIDAILDDRHTHVVHQEDRENIRPTEKKRDALHPAGCRPTEKLPPRPDEEKRSKQRRNEAVYFLDLHERNELEMARKVLSKSSRPTKIVYTLNKDVTHILTHDERSWKNKQRRVSSTQEIRGSGRASKLAKVATEQTKQLPRGLTHAEMCARYGMKIVHFEQIENQSKKLDLEERLALEKKASTPKLPVLLIEDLTGKFKPVAKEFPWTKEGKVALPYLDFDAAPGTCPFVFPGKSGTNLKARKPRAKQHGHLSTKRKRDSQGNKRLKWRVSRAGYCEVCAVNYDEYSKHVEKPEHIERKRKDPTNKLLDDLFASLGTQTALPLVFASPAKEAAESPTEAVPVGSAPGSKVGSSTKIESTPQENQGACKVRRRVVIRSSEQAVHQRSTRNTHQKQIGTGMCLRGNRRPLVAVNQ